MVAQVGLGLVSLDFLAAVACYPKPDDKIRSTDLKVTDAICIAVLSSFCGWELDFEGGFVIFEFLIELVLWCCTLRYKEVEMLEMR